MQKVEVIQREVKPVVPAVVQEEFVLRLTRAEAEFILRVTGCVPTGMTPPEFQDTHIAIERAVGDVETSWGERRFSALWAYR